VLKRWIQWKILKISLKLVEVTVERKNHLRISQRLYRVGSRSVQTVRPKRAPHIWAPHILKSIFSLILGIVPRRCQSLLNNPRPWNEVKVEQQIHCKEMYPTFLQLASQRATVQNAAKRTELCRVIDTHRMALLTSTKWRRTVIWQGIVYLVPWPYTIYFITLLHDIACSCWKCRLTPINQPTFCKEDILLLFTVLYCYLLGPRGTAADWCKSRTQQLTLVRRNPGHCKHRPSPWSHAEPIYFTGTSRRWFDDVENSWDVWFVTVWGHEHSLLTADLTFIVRPDTVPVMWVYVQKWPILYKWRLG